jgi:uncharacterized protein YbjQ (UPF0145 family)
MPMQNMILSTTPTLENKKINTYLGIVTGEAIIGANLFRDLFAGIRDIVGGRSGSYEEVLREAIDNALNEMEENARRIGANAVVGVDLDYETVGANGSMLMVTASGTAVITD